MMKTRSVTIHESLGRLFEQASLLLETKNYSGAAYAYEHYLKMADDSRNGNATTAMRNLAGAQLALDDLKQARKWTDRFYGQDGVASDDYEPAYQLCRALRVRGQHALAYYYCLVATAKLAGLVGTSSAKEDAVDHILLDYEKSILWYYVGDAANDRRSSLYILGLCMNLLDNPTLNPELRESVASNLQYYALRLDGHTQVLARDQADSEWRYSTPLFIDGTQVAIVRQVNYNISEDGSYRTIPPSKQVDTRLVHWGINRTFVEVVMGREFAAKAVQEGLHHPNASVIGLEDSRIVARDGVLYTLSSSTEYSRDGRTFSQVLGTLDLAAMTHTVVKLIQGPDKDQSHEKNWVFATGLDNVVYEWYPYVRIGAVDAIQGKLQIHTEIPSPLSFEGMRGSSNGVLHAGEWWFVTHSAIYRPGQMRKYLHRLVVLDKNLTQIVRHSLPFTFEEGSDVEYCIAFAADSARGLVFGYSVRDRASKVRRARWDEIGGLF
jgi:hypothetical protein